MNMIDPKGARPKVLGKSKTFELVERDRKLRQELEMKVWPALPAGLLQSDKPVPDSTPMFDPFWSQPWFSYIEGTIAMVTPRKKRPEDYAGGGSDFPQDVKDASSSQKGMIDDDMGKYGGVRPNKVPKAVDREFKRVAGGGSPGSFHGKKKRAHTKGSIEWVCAA
jgi:hypothetical protein